MSLRNQQKSLMTSGQDTEEQPLAVTLLDYHLVLQVTTASNRALVSHHGPRMDRTLHCVLGSPRPCDVCPRRASVIFSWLWLLPMLNVPM